MFICLLVNVCLISGTPNQFSLNKFSFEQFFCLCVLVKLLKGQAIVYSGLWLLFNWIIPKYWHFILKRSHTLLYPASDISTYTEAECLSKTPISYIEAHLYLVPATPLTSPISSNTPFSTISHSR